MSINMEEQLDIVKNLFTSRKKSFIIELLFEHKQES